MSYQNYIFDLDGTLVDSGDLIIESFAYALKPFGHTISHVDIENIRTRKTQELMDGYVHSAEDKVLALSRLFEYSNQHLEKNLVFPGMVDLLQSLKSKNKRAFIWTGRDTESAIQIAELKNISKYFTEIVGNTTITHNKPHPEGLLYIIEKYSLKKSETVMIGDHAHDIEGAKDAEIDSVHARWGANKALSYNRINPTHSFMHVTDLHQII